MNDLAGERQSGLALQLDALDAAVTIHRDALALGEDIRAEDLIALTRFVTQLEIAGVVKSW